MEPAAHSVARAAAHQLVPGRPINVRLCRYTGGLVGSQILRGGRAQSLGAQFDALKAPYGRVYHCPADSGAEVVASFHYRSRPDDAVVVHLDGCQLVSNGLIQRWAAQRPGPQLIRRLLTLTHVTRK